MPGHFTHIYTARRVADLLASGTFKDWPERSDEHTNGARNYSPEFCGTVMRDWEKFTAIGAIGPDLFYFSQDYNNDILGPKSDLLMLALATYYFLDAAMEDNWEPLLIILDQINSDMAAILRILIKLDKIWQQVVDAWDATIGPLVDAASEILDDLTGGLVSQFQVTLEELKLALINIGKEELLTFKDIFSMFDSCVEKGWAESSFLWSDVSHYRLPSTLCQTLVDEAEALRRGEDGETRFQQFLAFTLGYMTHVGTDVIAHSFINEQCGGPYRNHPQRHHLIENHIDAWNYKQTAPDGSIPQDPWAWTEDYPELSMSAMWFAVQLTPDEPRGKQRPSPLPDDAKARKAALDVDGEMPLWMAESIVKAMIRAFPEDTPHPKIYGGDEFQRMIDLGLLSDTIKSVTGADLDRPFNELLTDIAPPPPFSVPRGFPLPWQIQTMYRVMITYYKFSYKGTWELQKPRKPDFIITPPASDVAALFQPPDFSGVDSSDPVEDVCAIFIALFEWVIKEIGAAIKLAGDLVKMVISPFTYPIRLGLYELAMMIWDVVVKTHDVLAHTGFTIPHAEQLYDDGELRLPNEIDVPLITLGSSVDSAFQQALADAFDPLGNLDKDPSVIGIDHSVRDPNYPYYPVLRYHATPPGGAPIQPEGWEYHRPWAYPDISLFTPDGTLNLRVQTPTETYDASLPTNIAPPGPYPTVRPGPYPEGTTPDQVFFRTDAPIDRRARAQYEKSQSPAETDQLNLKYLDQAKHRVSPMGDPIPFSAYLIGRLANQTEYLTQFNLDSDRGYGYLTWDWIRGEVIGTAGMGFKYAKPIIAPPGSDDWDRGKLPLRLKYVDAAPIASKTTSTHGNKPPTPK